MAITYEYWDRLWKAIWFANGLRRQTKETGQATVFCDFSGHVGAIHLIIVPDGWSMDEEGWTKNAKHYWLYSYTSAEIWDEAIKAVEAIANKEG